jgi:hypothetical protein
MTHREEASRRETHERESNGKGRTRAPIPFRLVEPMSVPCHCGPHLFATFELVISRDGRVVRRLRPVPGGFVEVTYET